MTLAHVLTAEPIFRAVSHSGKEAENAITGHTVANVVKRYAKLAEPDP